MLNAVESAADISRGHTIKPRPLPFSPAADAPRYWANESPFDTLLMTVLSTGFPAGEHVFIESVRAFRDRITDPRLLEQIRAFIKQEGLHSHNHVTLNAWPGAPANVDKLLSRATKFIEAAAKRRTPLENLASTCAIEHFTAMMGRALLTHDDGRLLSSMAEPFRSLWMWHALEELDHKAVAFDVFMAVSGDHALRRRAMLVATFDFVVMTSLVHLQALIADGQLTRPRGVLNGFWRYWGPRGLFTSVIPEYLAYFRQDFHPWQRDDRALIDRIDRLLSQTALAA